MEPAEFVADVETATETELGRLGSPKLLVALTGADLTADPVLRTAAGRARATRETFRTWASEAANERARELFEAAADARADACDRLLDELDDEEPPAAAGGAVDALAELSGPVERAGGLVGWTLVADRAHAQFVAFFVNEAASGRADLFRDLRDDVGEVQDAAVEFLDAACGSDADRDRAASAAASVVRAAYEAYAAALTDLGLDPKPVC